MISKNTERILSLGNSGTITRNSTQISSLSSPPLSNRRGGGEKPQNKAGTNETFPIMVSACAI